MFEHCSLRSSLTASDVCLQCSASRQAYKLSEGVIVTACLLLLQLSSCPLLLQAPAGLARCQWPATPTPAELC